MAATRTHRGGAGRWAVRCDITRSIARFVWLDIGIGSGAVESSTVIESISIVELVRVVVEEVTHFGREAL